VPPATVLPIHSPCCQMPTSFDLATLEHLALIFPRRWIPVQLGSLKSQQPKWQHLFMQL
jgi:hypothetical protein